VVCFSRFDVVSIAGLSNILEGKMSWDLSVRAHPRTSIEKLYASVANDITSKAGGWQKHRWFQKHSFAS